MSSARPGIYLVLFVQCLHRLLTNPPAKRAVGHRVLLGYTLLLFAVQTVYFIGGCKWSAIEFVDAQVDPAVFAGELSSHLALLKDTMYTVNIWLADSFIVSRFQRTFGVLVG